MGIFGWSYPPGAANDPMAPWNQADGVSQITDYIDGLPANIDLYWTEDGVLIVQTQEGEDYPQQRSVGDLDWNDDLSEEANYKAAAAEAWRLYQADKR